MEEQILKVKELLDNSPVNSDLEISSLSVATEIKFKFKISKSTIKHINEINETNEII